MVVSTVTPIRASTQEHLDIEDIQDDIVILKTGACAIILQITAINFNLLSESEQDAIIFAYAGLLNSLTFPIQIMVRSTIKDVTDYIRLVKRQEETQKKPLLLEQLHKYREFIETIVKDNQVLDKKFFVVIPFTTLELGLVNTVTSSFTKKKRLPYPKSYILERAKMNLYPKRDHLFRQFARLGLQARQLNTQQLLELFYSLYNQESVGVKFTSSHEYATPIVLPASAQPVPLGNPVLSFPQPVSTTLHATTLPPVSAQPALLSPQPAAPPAPSFSTTPNVPTVSMPTPPRPPAPSPKVTQAIYQNPPPAPSMTGGFGYDTAEG